FYTQYTYTSFDSVSSILYLEWNKSLNDYDSITKKLINYNTNNNRSSIGHLKYSYTTNNFYEDYIDEYRYYSNNKLAAIYRIDYSEPKLLLIDSFHYPYTSTLQNTNYKIDPSDQPYLHILNL